MHSETILYNPGENAKTVGQNVHNLQLEENICFIFDFK